MNSYFIKELNSEVTYIELRLLSYLDCELKIEKLTDILNFLRVHHFLINLTTIYGDDMTTELMNSERHYEQKDVMSLTIDVNNDKMRFKFWNGASTQWFYHTEDLLSALDTGREKFSELYDKYEPVTDILLDFKRRWTTSIFHVTYNYLEDDDYDIVYHITFYEEVKKADYTNHLLKKINDEIIMLGNDITENLNFKIEHSFRTKGCTPCQQAKKERKQNEEKDKTSNAKND